MSRHRNVRNLDLDDVMDDGYDEDDYIEEQAMTAEEQAQMAEATEEVLSMLSGAKVSMKEIQDALWYYYFDVDQAAVYLIDELAKKQKAANAAVKKTPAPKPSQSGTPTPISTPKSTAPKAKDVTPKAAATISSPSSVQDDDIIEFLDDEDIPEGQLRFDLSAMNFGTSLKPSSTATKSTKTASSTMPKSAASLSAMGTPLLGSALADQSGMSSPNESAPPSGISTPTKASTKLGKRIDVVTEYQKRVAEKESLNLVVIGHVDAGKSTLMGHLLYLQGEVNEKTIRKHERDAQKIGKASFAFAWVLDETGEERARGITMDVGVTKFETEHRRFTLLDAPGHRDFIPNMISGTAQADVAILVVDATTGEFESGFDANGQTKEHALLARSLGVQQLVVAINKLDVVGWSEARFVEIVQKLEQFLVKDASFKKSNLVFIPCSGFTGENLVRRSTAGRICNGSAVSDATVGESIGSVVDTFAWYKGPTLVETIDKLAAPTRPVEKPLRMSVTDVFKGTGGVAAAGRLEAGHVQLGEAIMVMPGSVMATVKTLEVNDEPVRWAAAGDSVVLTLSGIDILQVSNGSVLCARDEPVPVTTNFAAQIVVFDVKIPITVGFPIIIHHQSHNEPAVISKLVATIDKGTGEVIRKSPRHLGKNTTAMVEIRLNGRAIPLETFKDSKELGRVMLRKGGETVAAGIVTNILSFGS
ncbi:HBS1-like protein [Mortierella sp. GBA30]|nr:HBS1-like protein [Mortierella sp. GBA30]